MLPMQVVGLVVAMSSETVTKNSIVTIFFCHFA